MERARCSPGGGNDPDANCFYQRMLHGRNSCSGGVLDILPLGEIMTVSAEAIFTELSLDGGKRAALVRRKLNG